MDDEPQLDSWTDLNEGFSDLVPFLNPDDTESEVDKVVCFILEQNIQVRYINIKYKYYSVNQVHKRPIEKLNMKQNCPGIKFGRFSTRIFGDDESIRRQMKKLISEAKIENPAKLIANLKSQNEEKKRIKFKKGLKSNILGAYLGQELPYIRLSCDVFNRAVTLFHFNNTGHYTKEEVTFILESVEQLGESPNTFKHIAHILKRPNYCNIENRYNLISNYKGCNKGFWTSSDFETFFDYIFGKANSGKQSGPDYIQSVSIAVIYKAAELLNRFPPNVYLNWLKSIKTTLLDYHIGNLHSDCRMELYEYLVEKKVKAPQEIDWKEVLSKFPNHNYYSISKELTTVYRHKNYKCQPLFKTIQDCLPKLRKKSEQGVMYREKVVHFYNKARGV